MPQAAIRVITDLTCWKCSEESLVEAINTSAARGTHGELMASTHVHHSDCPKCGAYSVNAAQARLNKIAGRKARKEVIREGNRTSA